MPKNWQQREKKLDKRRNGMRVSNRGIFTMEEANRKRDEEKVRRERERREGRKHMT